MVGRPNAAEKVAITKRRADAIELRLAGVDTVTIGKKLAADPNINLDGIAYPQGYGIDKYKTGDPPPTDEQFTQAVCQDLARALKERQDMAAADRVELRTLEAQRLDRLFLVVWRQALAGDLAAVDRALRIQDRRAKLLGLDEPSRQLSGIVTDVDPEALEMKMRQVLGLE